MNDEQQLKLQAFLDGELPEAETREISAWVARDAEATALLKELRQTRQAFKSTEANVQLPESREFYWSKIQREIERDLPAAPPQRPSLFHRFRRVLVPVGAFAVLVVISILTFPRGNGIDSEMAVADSEAFTYQDYDSGTTLVWVSYPAER
ncbi:MAG TPA: hypothetical protein VEH04_01295 [Verrucomicrobiae bacterium]|nr:hypothetical protein [Verrucomicrobiae bacterium]